MQRHLRAKPYLPKDYGNQIGVILRHYKFLFFPPDGSLPKKVCSVSSSGSSFPIDSTSLMGLDFLLTPPLFGFIVFSDFY